jgi:hypothetical protein
MSGRRLSSTAAMYSAGVVTFSWPFIFMTSSEARRHPTGTSRSALPSMMVVGPFGHRTAPTVGRSGDRGVPVDEAAVSGDDAVASHGRSALTRDRQRRGLSGQPPLSTRWRACWRRSANSAPPG